MFAEPAGFDRDALTRTLSGEWGIIATALRYEPLGFGTHHYRVTDGDGTSWFVNVDELSHKTWLGGDNATILSNLERSLRTAVELRDAGLDFVHAPRPAVGGEHAVAGIDGYAVSVYPFIVGESHPFGEFPTDEERRLVLSALGRIHATTVANQFPVRETLVVPLRGEFEAALVELATPWTGGPFAEPTRALVRSGAGLVRDDLARFDELVPRVAAGQDDWVVTHGEPHAGNVMRPTDGSLRLIDWDTVKLGPRERDLWMIPPRDEDDWAAYGQPERADPEVMEYYRLAWRLAEVVGYVAEFREPHVDDANTQLGFQSLRGYLTAPR